MSGMMQIRGQAYDVYSHGPVSGRRRFPQRSDRVSYDRALESNWSMRAFQMKSAREMSKETQRVGQIVRPPPASGEAVGVELVRDPQDAPGFGKRPYVLERVPIGKGLVSRRGGASHTAPQLE